MCLFYKWKDIFGKPNENIHSIRLFDFAIIDILMTLLGAFLLSKYFKKNSCLLFIILFIYGQIFHILFCVKTKFIVLFFS
jgi:hypothetical protein